MLDGVHEGRLVVGHNAAVGMFTVHVVTVDRAGNRLDRTMPEKVEIGASHGDDEAPRASEVTVEPALISSSSTVTVTARITEPARRSWPGPPLRRSGAAAATAPGMTRRSY